MTLADQIVALPNGGRFYRADLHIHSWRDNGSPCVGDSGMTPNNIVRAAHDAGLSLISITDHNYIGNVQDALRVGEELGVVVVPGVELSTIQGHLLVFFETFEALERFFGKLEFNDDRSSCRLTIPQCLTEAARFEGIGIAAHIDRAGGFEIEVPGYGDRKKEIAEHVGLLGLELSQPDALDWFSPDDASEARREMLARRCNAIGAHDDYRWPTVRFSDSHSLEDLMAAESEGRITRFKMDSPTFGGLRIALLDSMSRVRTEESIPRTFPRFVGIQTEGGFLGDQMIHFNENLNCIIGGRGTGKSTLLQSLLVAAGIPSRSDLVDSDVWPEMIRVVFQDETGTLRTYERRKGKSSTLSRSDGPDRLPYAKVESYGQGETAARIQNCKDDPIILLDFLDSFTGVGVLLQEDSSLRNELERNGSELASLEEDLAEFPGLVERLNDVQEKVEALRQQDVGGLVVLEEALSNGQSFRGQVIDKLNDLFKAVAGSLGDRQPFDTLIELQPKSLPVGAEQLERIRTIVADIRGELDAAKEQWEGRASSYIEQLRTEIEAWKEHEANLETEVEEKRQELEKKGIRPNLSFIRSLTEEHAKLNSRRAELLRIRKQRLQFLSARRKLVKKRRRCRERISAERSAWAERVSKELRGTSQEYEITVKFRSGKLSHELPTILQEVMGWRTAQVPKAPAVSRAFSPFELLDIGQKGSHSDLSSIETQGGSAVLTKDECVKLLEMLVSPHLTRRLEHVEYEDLPKIWVSKKNLQASGPSATVTREFTKLSLGQQQAVLLSILMLSRSRLPLIIDQPEDNLDNEFIYRTIVGNLKRVKEQRQVIIVTHNANIAVLGDSELILPLKATSELARVMAEGSIDSSTTRVATCEILEGSEEAFRRRGIIYGIG